MKDEGNFSGSTFFGMEKGLPPISDNCGEDISQDNKILIFSQEYDTRLLLKTFLEILGYRTETAECPEALLTIIEARKPDLILIDSALPFSDHIENIRQIRRIPVSKDIPIITISGFAEQEYKIRSAEVGADGFLVKPLDFDLLEKYLKRCLKSRTEKN